MLVRFLDGKYMQWFQEIQDSAGKGQLGRRKHDRGPITPTLPDVSVNKTVLTPQAEKRKLKKKTDGHIALPTSFPSLNPTGSLTTSGCWTRSSDPWVGKESGSDPWLGKESVQGYVVGEKRASRRLQLANLLFTL